MKLTFVSAPEKFKGVKSKLYIYQDETSNKYIYKEFIPPFKEKVENELLAHSLAKLAGFKFLDFIDCKKLPNRDRGILMNYLETASILADFKGDLTSRQKQDLRRIVLFDIWIGNADRHTANILVTDRLIPFDHTNLFKQSEKATDFIKLDIGRRIDKEYIEKLERLLQLKLTAEEALIKWLEFKEDDFKHIKNIEDQEIRKIVKGPKYVYLIGRKKKLSEFPFI